MNIKHNNQNIDAEKIKGIAIKGVDRAYRDLNTLHAISNIISDQLTILIDNHNSIDYIKEALTSIRTLLFHNKDIINDIKIHENNQTSILLEKTGIVIQDSEI